MRMYAGSSWLGMLFGSGDTRVGHPSVIATVIDLRRRPDEKVSAPAHENRALLWTMACPSRIKG